MEIMEKLLFLPPGWLLIFGLIAIFLLQILRLHWRFSWQPFYFNGLLIIVMILLFLISFIDRCLLAIFSWPIIHEQSRDFLFWPMLMGAFVHSFLTGLLFCLTSDDEVREQIPLYPENV